MSVIEVHDLAKRFRVARRGAGLTGALKHLVHPRYTERVAVEGISLTISAGECVGYVGPNGAGKSTTVKMLTGILAPTRGEISVCGLDPHRRRMENNRNIGVIFGQRTQLWWDPPVRDSLLLLADIYEVPRPRFKTCLAELVELLGLGDLLDRPARTLSLGERMRCDIAAALIHSPRVLFLDEPTIGLDVAVKARIRQFLKHRCRDEGMTILLTSHDIGEIEDLCPRMIMIDRGRIVFDGPLRAIRERFGGTRSIHFALRETPSDQGEAARRTLATTGVSHRVRLEGRRMTVEFDATQVTAGTIVGLMLPQLVVEDLRVEEPTVESIIRRLYEGTLKLEPLGP